MTETDLIRFEVAARYGARLGARSVDMALCVHSALEPVSLIACDSQQASEPVSAIRLVESRGLAWLLRLAVAI